MLPYASESAAEYYLLCEGVALSKGTESRLIGCESDSANHDFFGKIKLSTKFSSAFY